MVRTLALAPPPATGAELFTPEDMESEDSMWALYDRWGARYGVVRDAGDKLRRFGIFKETARRVYAAHPGDKHYVLGLNIFADMATDEFRAAYACERSRRWRGAPRQRRREADHRHAAAAASGGRKGGTAG